MRNDMKQEQSDSVLFKTIKRLQFYLRTNTLSYLLIKTVDAVDSNQPGSRLRRTEKAYTQGVSSDVGSLGPKLIKIHQVPYIFIIICIFNLG